MTIIDNRTANKNWPLPNIDNRLEDDVARVRAALIAIDAELVTLFDALVLATTPAAHVGSGAGAHAVAAPGGAAGFMSGADKTKLNGAALLTDLTKSAVGLGNADNTSDANKPISTAAANALATLTAAIDANTSAILLRALKGVNTDITSISPASILSGLLTGVTFRNPANTEQTLVDAATTAWDMDAGHVAKWLIGATGRTLGLPTNIKVGGQYQLLAKLATPATMTPAFNAIFKFQYDTLPVFSTSTYTFLTMAWSSEHGKLLVFPAPGF